MENPTTANETDHNAGFGHELRSCWNALPNKTLFFSLLAAWAVLFQFLGSSTFGYIDTPSLFRWMHNAYGVSDTGDDAHGKLIPFVVLGLFWWKRKELLAQATGTWWPGLLMVAVALALHVVGYLVQQPRLSIIALFAGIYGLMGLAWGPHWLRASFFPYFLFVFCVPMAVLTEPVTFPLRLMVSKIVVFVCNHVLAIDVARDGTQLFNGMRSYQYEVAAACSGIRSLVAITAIAIIYAFVAFQTAGKRALIIVSAVPLAVIGNVFRMMMIVIAAEIGGQEWGAFVHEGGPLAILSLLPYIPAIIGLILLGRWLEKRAFGQKGAAIPVREQPTTT